MTASEIELLINGRHGDAFRILGPHLLKPSAEGERWEISAFLPQAEKAAVLIKGVEHSMRRRHAGGVFAVALDGEPVPYRLQLTHYDGTREEIDDPYRFPPLLTDYEIHLHGEGTNFESYRTLGAHLIDCDGVAGVRFAVWAPNAESVAVTGDFNHWDTRRHPMRRRNGGIWELFLPGMQIGATYKYHVRSMVRGYEQMKADPYAYAAEIPPKSASVVWSLENYQWHDAQWMDQRAQTEWLKQPISVYEVHLESWLKGPGFTFLTYRDFATKLVAYVKRMGYTHIELLPIMEHPFSGSWGYQVTGYFAPTSRFGTPDDFMYFVDQCHQANIGVIIDWVPAHFPKDAHGLAFFDGTALYEHDDPRKGEHRDWGTLIFNFGRNEVREFLIANALFWLKKYHVDGLRVDAVASMLYLDYSRKEGDWVPNVFGGRENLEAIDFLRRFNELVHQVPGALTFAEESTSFPGVSRPVYLNGLGFTLKWNMGWMHDMLHYFEQNPVYRKYNHNEVTFSLLYAFTENFVLPISHDEVVHGKGSLLAKMPGDMWQQFANCRAFFAFMYTHPGKKLLFMGTEVGQWNEWNNYGSVEWDLLQFPLHSGLQTMVRELNHFYRSQKALYEVDFHWQGFEWLDFRDVENSIVSFIRRAEDPSDFLVVCCNLTPVVRHNYGFGVPEPGFYEAVFNSDAAAYGGSNVHNGHGVSSYPGALHGHGQSIHVSLPPLAVIVFRLRRPEPPPEPLPELVLTA